MFGTKRRGRNLARVSTPVTFGGLRKYDDLPPADAAAKAWATAGSHPGWDADAKATVEALCPVLARALDRLVAEQH